MRTLNEVMASSPERYAFSNGTEGYDWMSRWCNRCHHPVEMAWQSYENGKRKTQLKGYEGGCPLLMASMVGHTHPRSGWSSPTVSTASTAWSSVAPTTAVGNLIPGRNHLEWMDCSSVLSGGFACCSRNPN